ncbi:MAG: DUF3634 family protein [Polyangiaceae bacterium]
MSGFFWLGLLCLALLAIFYGLRRANELFALSARDGTLTVVRGRLPPALLSDLGEIAARERLGNVEIRVVSESGVPRLFSSGAPPAFEQAARNVLGRFSVAQLRAGRRRARR